MQQKKEAKERGKRMRERREGGGKGNENTVRLFWLRNVSSETAELQLPEIKSRLAHSCLHLERPSQ